MNTSFTFNFTTREQYLQQKAAWFQAYKQARQAVVLAKIGIKDAMRNGTSIYEAYKQKWRTDDALTELLKQRAASRVEAQRQYLAQKVAA